MLLIKIGASVGALNTVLIVIFTGVLGAAMARVAGLQVLFRIQDQVQAGVVPAEELFDGLLILVGGILLITPGLITDGFGFLLLIPRTRRLVKLWVRRWVKQKLASGEITYSGSPF
jgi:UPF0716 protein FxsA